MTDRYGRDVLSSDPHAPRRRVVREVEAEPGLVVECATSGFCGAVVLGPRRTGDDIFSNVNAGIVYPLAVELEHSWYFLGYPDEAEAASVSTQHEWNFASTVYARCRTIAFTLRTQPHDPKVSCHVRSAFPDIRRA